MHVIVGLGNPGSEYENTRHNLGFAVVDSAANMLGIRLKEGKGDYLLGEKSLGSDHALLVKPLTYMNNSGWAVRDIVERYNLQLDELLIVVDDFHLPLGVIRLRLKGSDGGHNGLYSIIHHLGSAGFARLRCGIGNEKLISMKNCTADFVLSAFEENEAAPVHSMVIRARDAIVKSITDGFEGTQEFLSRKKIN